MTPQQRAELERLAAAATPGPWLDVSHHWPERAIPVITEEPATIAYAAAEEFTQREADAAFIAAARDAVPALLAENERLRTALESVEWVRQRYNGRAECPWCHRYRPDSSDGPDEPDTGHSPGCRRNAALAEPEP